jgi:hypothetical protein
MAHLPPIVIPGLGDLEYVVKTKRKTIGRWSVLVTALKSPQQLDTALGTSFSPSKALKDRKTKRALKKAAKKAAKKK